MGSSLGSWLIRLLIATVTVVFIYPAIGFACLVIGFTSSWRSGLWMLGSALLMLVILKWESRQFRPARRSGRSTVVQELGQFPGVYDNDASPPPLSDIYYDIAKGLREQECLLDLLNKDAEDTRRHSVNCRCVACSVNTSRESGKAHGA
ncbi:hypothetical protein A8990_14035 [Paenibacillus taihuensis]|uniref:Uncharacterized protein n=1 Tax=Paenibacillus taihuensis TaxID=1156355 RepID=A0A3D9QV12_9BACL|nr:hypothetical protein [Paenibacillus taihuensis]REE67986.1 hypothetical protein A8990_14035 [Paenibacillus taihuensis]